MTSGEVIISLSSPSTHFFFSFFFFFSSGSKYNDDPFEVDREAEWTAFKRRVAALVAEENKRNNITSTKKEPGRWP